MTPGPLRTAALLVRQNLRVEAHSREVLMVTAPFGAVALLMVPLAIGTDTPLLRTVGPGVYWVIVLLFGALVTLRGSAAEPPAVAAVLRLCGVDPVVGLAARAGANSVLVLAFEMVLVPVAVAVYDPDLSGWPVVIPMVGLVAVGLGLLGALVDTVTRGQGERTTLGALLVIPLTLPLLLGATQATDGARPGVATWPWLLLVTAFDLLLATVCAACARHLDEEM